MKGTVFISGASSGIGEACAYKFAKDGYNLILTGRNSENLEAVKTNVEKIFHSSENHKEGKVKTILFDVRDFNACRAAVETLFESENAWEKRIDVLINNAGGALGLEPMFEGDIEDWETMIDANVKGLLYLTRLIVPKMREQNKGDIINIGSVAGDAAYASGAVYCATKSAVKILSDGLRIDLVDTPLRVTNIKPGLVKTNFSNVRFHQDKERAERVYQGIEALKAEDIADIALYVANAPAHVQIAEVLVLATNQANGSTIHRIQ